MISAWALVSIVPLIGSNIYALKKIQELRDALTAKEILLDSNYQGANVAAGGVMVRTFERPIRRVRVISSSRTRLTLEASE